MRLLPVCGACLPVFLRHVLAVEIAAAGQQDSSKNRAQIGYDAQVRTVSTHEDSVRAAHMRREALPASGDVQSRRSVQAYASGEVADTSNQRRSYEESIGSIGSAAQYQDGYGPTYRSSSSVTGTAPSAYSSGTAYPSAAHSSAYVYTPSSQSSGAMSSTLSGAGYAHSTAASSAHTSPYYAYTSSSSSGYAYNSPAYTSSSSGYAYSSYGGSPTPSGADYAQRATFGGSPVPAPTPPSSASSKNSSGSMKYAPGKPASRQEMFEAQQTAAKFQQLEYRAEQKAGLPDTIYTSSTAEPAAEREAEQEETSLAYTAISLAVILASVSVFSSLYTKEQARKLAERREQQANAEPAPAPAPASQQAPASGGLGGWGGWGS